MIVPDFLFRECRRGICRVVIYTQNTLLLVASSAKTITYLSWRKDMCLATFESLMIDVERVFIAPLSFLILICISDLTIFTHSERVYKSSFSRFAHCLA